MKAIRDYFFDEEEWLELKCYVIPALIIAPISIAICVLVELA